MTRISRALWRIEWKKAWNRKAMVLLLVSILLPLVLSAYTSYQAAGLAQRQRSLWEMQLQQNAQIAAQNLSMGDLDEASRAYYEAAQDLWNAFESGDTRACLEAKIRQDEAVLAQAQAGIRFQNHAETLEEARDNLERNTILLSQNIEPRDPFLEPHDGVGSIFWFLTYIQVYLLPGVTLLLCADGIAGEFRGGGIKFLLQTPQRRFSIVWKKYIINALFGILCMLVSMPASFAGGALFSGAGDFRYPMEAQGSFFALGDVLYLPAWQLLLRALAVGAAAVLFYTALGILLSVLFRRGAAALLVSAVLGLGAVFFCRQNVRDALGGPLQFTPFAASDPFLAAAGSFSFTVTGENSFAFEVQTKTIESPFAGIFAVVLLLGFAAVCAAAAGGLFSKKEV